jgi:hypothetical protein
MVGHEPIAERERCPAVLLVVVGDLRQELVVPRLRPLLLRQHGIQAAPDAGLSEERGESFDLLQ